MVKKDCPNDKNQFSFCHWDSLRMCGSGMWLQGVDQSFQAVDHLTGRRLVAVYVLKPELGHFLVQFFQFSGSAFRFQFLAENADLLTVLNTFHQPLEADAASRSGIDAVSVTCRPGAETGVAERIGCPAVYGPAQIAFVVAGRGMDGCPSSGNFWPKGMHR